MWKMRRRGVVAAAVLVLAVSGSIGPQARATSRFEEFFVPTSGSLPYDKLHWNVRLIERVRHAGGCWECSQSQSMRRNNQYRPRQAPTIKTVDATTPQGCWKPGYG